MEGESFFHQNQGKIQKGHSKNQIPMSREGYYQMSWLANEGIMAGNWEDSFFDYLYNFPTVPSGKNYSFPLVWIITTLI